MIKEIHLGKGSKFRFDMDKLKAIENQVKKRYVARVGILGARTERTAEDEKGKKQKVAVTNAEIGLAMEKGVKSKNIPRRSWLEQPLVFRSEKLLEYATQLFDDMTKENIVIQYKLLGKQAEAIIQEAFEVGGLGIKWPKPKYRDGAPLIDTGQLRRSVSSTVASV